MPDIFERASHGLGKAIEDFATWSNPGRWWPRVFGESDVEKTYSDGSQSLKGGGVRTNGNDWKKETDYNYDPETGDITVSYVGQHGYDKQDHTLSAPDPNSTDPFTESVYWQQIGKYLDTLNAQGEEGAKKARDTAKSRFDSWMATTPNATEEEFARRFPEIYAQLSQEYEPVSIDGKTGSSTNTSPGGGKPSKQFLTTDQWSYYTDANGNNVNYTQDDVDKALQARFDAIYGGKSGTFTDIIDFMSRATPQQVKKLFEWELADDPYGTGALVASLMDSFSNDTYGNFGYEDLWTEDGGINLNLLAKIIEGERKTNVLPDMIQLISQGGDGAAAALSKLIGSNGYFLDDLGSYLASQLGQGYGAAYDNDIDALTQMISTMTPEDYDKATRQAQLANMMMLVSSGAGGSDLSEQAVKEMQRLMGDLDYEFGDVSPDFSIVNDYLDTTNPDWKVTGMPDFNGFGQYDYEWFDNPTYDSLPLAWIAALSDEARPISKK